MYCILYFWGMIHDIGAIVLFVVIGIYVPKMVREGDAGQRINGCEGDTYMYDVCEVYLSEKQLRSSNYMSYHTSLHYPIR